MSDQAIHITQQELQAIVADALARAMDNDVISPFRAYTAEQAGRLLGFKKWQTIYDIPSDDLPQCRVGPSRGAIRYFGADLLAYLKGVDPLDVGAILDEVRSRISAPAPVHPMPSPTGKTRLM